MEQTKMSVSVVHSNNNGFVTDFGNPLTFTTDNRDIEIPRYGVWKNSSRGKPEVVYTTNDLEEAKGQLE